MTTNLNISSLKQTKNFVFNVALRRVFEQNVFLMTIFFINFDVVSRLISDEVLRKIELKYEKPK